MLGRRMQQHRQRHGHAQKQGQRPKAGGSPAEGYEAHARLLSAQNGRPRRHPARLVGDAVEMLGVAQETIRGKACRAAIRKSRAALIEMLDGPRSGNAAAGRRLQRQQKKQKQKQRRNRK